MTSTRMFISFVLTVFFTTLVVSSLTYPWEVRLAPLAVGTIGLVLSILELGSDISASTNPRGTHQLEPDRVRARHVCWLLILVGLILILGHVAGGLLFIVAYLKIALGRSWALALTFAIVSQGMLYGFFDKLVGIELFDGLLCELQVLSTQICR